MGGDKMQLEPNTLYASRDVATMLRAHDSTLRQWRRYGIGPDFIRTGPRRIMYRGDAILTWIEARTSSHAHGASQQQRGA